MYLVDYLNKGYTVVTTGISNKKYIEELFPGAKVAMGNDVHLASDKLVIDNYAEGSRIELLSKSKYPNGDMVKVVLSKEFVMNNAMLYISKVTIKEIFESEKLNIDLHDLDINEAIDLLEKMRIYIERKSELASTLVKLSK